MTYDIRVSLGPDGRRLYYIQDADSMARVGLIEKVEQFDQIVPTGGELIRLRAASNALYDTAVERLKRRKQVQNKFKVQVMPLERVLRVGDKVQIEFQDDYEVGGEILRPFHLSGDYWVMGVEEDWSDERIDTYLEISDVDVLEIDASELILSAIETVNRRAFTPSVASSVDTKVVFEDIDQSHGAEVGIKLSGAVRELQFVDITITPGPLRASNYDRVFSVFEDSATPQNMRLFLNGVDRTVELTGRTTVNPSGGRSPIEVDGDELTRLIKSSGVQDHVLRITCAGGRGRLKIDVEVYQSILSAGVG